MTSTILLINVIDINDNNPIFNQSKYYFTIKENVGTNCVVGKLYANDIDSGRNGEMYFYISSGDYRYFSINEMSGLIKTTRSIDYKQIRLFVLNVIVYDDGNPKLSSKATVFINIKDANDRLPRFVKNNSLVEIPEDIEIGSLVTVVSVIDNDSSNNILYSIVNGDPGKQFYVSNNGSVYVRKHLDHERESRYVLLLKVSNFNNSLNCGLSYVMLNITVSDINDNPPTLISNPWFHVPENAFIGTSIGYLKVFDPDIKSEASMTYRLLKLNSVFDVNLNGEIRLMRALDYEQQKEFQFRISICDRGQPSQNCIHTTIRVFVVDVNDNRPIFLSHSNNITVSEHAKPLQELIKLHAVDDDSGMNAYIKYSLESYTNAFQINELNGVVSIKNCSYLVAGISYRLNINVFDSGVPQLKDTTHVIVDIADVNERPTFSSDKYSLTLRENTGPKSLLTVVTASDNDIGLNSKLTYFINKTEHSDGYFSMHPKTGVISLLKPVDRETISVFNISIKVIDAGLPSLNAFTSVIVTIEDENDNAPTIDSDIILELQENSPIGVHIGTIKAKDLDEGKNSRLQYSLLNYQTMFRIDSNNGNIKTLLLFDYECKSVYQLLIQINDLGTPSRTIKANVKLKITDVNDSPPVYTKTNYSVNIQPGLPIGSFVLQFTVSDADTSINSQMNFFSKDINSLFYINKENGIITTQSNIENLTRVYTFQVHVFDPTYPFYKDVETVTVFVMPFSVFPFVNQPVIFVEIEEENEYFIHNSFTKVNATTTLAEPARQLTYSIVSLNSKYFSINKTNGCLYLRQKLDYESQKYYLIWVEIKDNQKNPMKSYVKVLAHVTNIDDNPPCFVLKQIQAQLPENKPSNTYIAKVTAVDIDGNNDNIRYETTSLDFSTNQTTGDVYSLRSFDYEVNTNFTLPIIAFDVTNKTKNDSLDLTILIENVNDNPPFIDNYFNVSILEIYPTNKSFFKIPSFDLDNLNALLFSINSTKFFIQPTSGALCLLEKLDREKKDYYKVDITVTDGKYVSKSVLYLHVVDVNDSPPQFEHPVITVKLIENTEVGTAFYKVNTTDEDVGINSKSCVYIHSTNRTVNEYFNVSLTGDIILQKSVMIRDAKALLFIFNITARNIAFPYHNNSVQVTVIVKDINNHPPVFTKRYYEAFVVSTATIGSRVIEIFAVDKFDLYQNAEIIYIIKHGNGTSLLSLLNGVILIKSPLIRRYINQWWQVIVEARDKGVPSLSAVCTVNVFVEELNRFSPVIKYSPYAKDVEEDIKINSKILKIVAVDKEDKNDLLYSINSEYINNIWEITNTGSLILRKPLDYETQETHLLVIRVCDRSHIDRKCSTTNVYITVTDVNDNKPIFEQTEYQVTISENIDAGTTISTVTAHDADSAVNNIIKYSFNNTNTAFHIHPLSGNITSVMEFDYETTSKYSFIVVATDNVSPPLFSLVNVDIYIQDINEYPPKFEFNYYHFTVSSYLTIGSLVGKVQATDKDKGREGVCRYSITSPREFGFAVDSLKGEIIISSVLSIGNKTFMVVVQNSPFVTVHSKDFIDFTIVQIEVVDSKCPPKFSKDVYQVSIYENASINTIIVNVTATELLYNHKSLIYKIYDDTKTFKVDPLTGAISTNELLDRETVEFFNFTVAATDSLLLTGYSTLNVHILDVNDNAPQVPINCTEKTAENSKIGTLITRLIAYDEDTKPNAKPFIFYLSEKNNKFALTHTGILTSKAVLDREDTSSYTFSVTVFDNGVPQLSSSIICFIEVTDINDNAGITRNVTIILPYSKDVEKIRFIGNISPIDIDSDDIYSCTMKSNISTLRFKTSSCDINRSVIALAYTDYQFDYKGHLGRESVTCSAHIQYYNVSSRFGDIVLKIHNMSVKRFVNNYLRSLTEYLNKEIIKKKNGRFTVTIISSQTDRTDGINIILGLNSSFSKDKEMFIKMMTSIETNLKKKLNGSSINIDYNSCQLNPCEHPKKCLYEVNRTTAASIINTESMIFHSLNYNFNTICQCPPGLVGKKCTEYSNSCKPYPCLNGAQCTETKGSFKCICSKYFHGTYCQLDKNECLNSPCQNGGRCINKYGGFNCICEGAFKGKLCELIKGPCSPNPCRNNATCLTDGYRYTCQCQYGDTGTTCNNQSMNFFANSYIKPYSKININDFMFFTEFATVERYALLFYSHSNASFLSIEINKSKIKVTRHSEFASVVIKSNLFVSDGNFHSVRLTASNNMLTLTVDKRDRVIEMHKLERETTAHSINIGGIKSLNNLSKNSRFHSIEFIGCMRNILLDQQSVNLSNTFVKHILSGCKRQNSCSENKCSTNGECIDLWSNYECKCRENYLSKSCDKAFQAVKFVNKHSLVRLTMTESYKRKLLLRKEIRARRDTLIRSSFVSLQFRTRKENSELLESFDESGDVTSLYIFKGKIHYKFTNGNSTGSTSLNQMYVTDGQWHNISMSVTGNIIQLSADSSQSNKHTFASMPHQFLNVFTKEIIFGQEFEGCFGKVQLNKDVVYLSSSTSKFQITTNGSIENECRSTDICFTNPCQNRSLKHCVDQWEAFTCVAPGKCKDNPCKNGGRCIPNGLLSFSCDCIRTRYGGEYCHIPNVCLSNPCKLNEVCNEYGDSFKCTLIQQQSDSFDKRYIIAIVLGIIIILTVIIAYFAARRKWQVKTVMKFNGNFVKAFDNYGQELDETRFHGDNFHSKKKDDLYRSNLSLPVYPNRSNQFARYANDIQRFRSVNEMADIQRGRTNKYSTRNFRPETPVNYRMHSDQYLLHTSHESLNQAMFTLINPQSAAQPFESGFESSCSDEHYDERLSVIRTPDVYNLDEQSIRFSEMSFQYDIPSNVPINNTQSVAASTVDTIFGSQTSEITDTSFSGSDVSFTCSECEHGTINENKARRNPAYILSKVNYSHQEHTREPIYYSSSVSFSNSDSACSSVTDRRTQRRRKRSQNLRRHIVNSAKKRHNENITLNIPGNARSYELENVLESEVEEYV